MKSIPRPEFPRPQFFRGDASFYNLNGEWAYRTDRAAEGEALGFFRSETPFPERITVPFSRESELSGIGDTGFCNGCWYRRGVTLPKTARGKRVLLHIDASDYLTRVWVNEVPVGTHEGGYTPMTFDITHALTDGENLITVGIKDDVKSGRQPAGKQSDREKSFDCSYTRTTGIWQTVWLEFVPLAYIKQTLYTPDVDRMTLTVEADVVGGEGERLSCAAFYEGRPVGEDAAVVRGGKARLVLSLRELHLWEVGQGRLYDLTLAMGEDRVESYFGMRKVEAREGILYLNDRPVFQRLVLDQGFYPDGIITAPTLAELEGDIDRALAMGFNGARLHQKVFEPAFLSLCDRKGYLVWGEFASIGIAYNVPDVYRPFLAQWCEVLNRDYNHPAIIGWCPLNETPKNRQSDILHLVAAVTRGFDRTRLYIDTSGHIHEDGITDIMDCHNYITDPEAFSAYFEPLKEGKPVNVHVHCGEGYEKYEYPTFVSEYGGARLTSFRVEQTDKFEKVWGYGGFESEEAFLRQVRGLTEALLRHPKMGGFCYTQLTDIEQEANGLYTYDRCPKVSPEKVAAFMTQKAAVEE